MTYLQRRVLAILPLTEQQVQCFYDGRGLGTPEQRLKSLCESHERLRAELQSAMILLGRLREKD